MEPLRASDPRQIGEYRLLGRLGDGGMGSVYLAQSSRGRTAAVKLVRSELAEHPAFRLRFEREVRAARQVTGEWTAPVLDAEPDAPQPWLATGYIPGISLTDAVEGQPDPLPERTVRILANRLALALGSVHEAGLVHRDVKPSNVLVTIDGPRLIDFGIARALEHTGDIQLTRTGAVVGSPAFMSPEQARGQRLTAASDIFSLGSALVFAATGRVPFGDEYLAAHAVLFRVAEDEPDLAGVPDGLRELLDACLEKDPRARPGLAEIVARTADPGGDPGPGRGEAGESGVTEPWLPAGLVAQLGQHAARLLDAEVPGAREAADRAADAYVRAPVLPESPEPPEIPELPSEWSEWAETTWSASDGPSGGAGAGAGARSGAGAGAAVAPSLPPVTPAGPPHGPAPREERRPRRVRAVMGALVALALIAGAGTLLALLGPDLRGGEGTGEAAPPRTTGAQGKNEGTDGAGPRPASGGEVPHKYLGTWQSAVRKPDGDGVVTQHVEIEQGREGDTVAKTVSVYKDNLCYSEGSLVSSKGGLRIKSEISQSRGSQKPCPQHTRQKLAHKNGALAWSAPGRRETVWLDRVQKEREKLVPEAMIGQWKMTREAAKEGEDIRVDFYQGPVGDALMNFEFTGRGSKEACEWVKTLGAVEDGALIYGGLTGPIAACGDGSDLAVPMVGMTMRVPMRVTMNGADEVRFNNPVDPGRSVILERAD
ncbi:protein kinase [Streptomyces sp. NPDC048172]|uniref:serine/threonine-protein kinase n=1 Tax=Streptomyces sp. NPDC048172 TaxID=3365505 RepID=UPI0037227D72